MPPRQQRQPAEAPGGAELLPASGCPGLKPFSMFPPLSKGP